MINGYLIALAVVLVWSGLSYFLFRTKWLERHNMSFWIPPIIMWKTQRGRSLIDRLARRPRFWLAYAKVSIWICVVLMVAVVALVAYDATLVPLVKHPPSPRLLLALPGINPIIPLGYGILALAVTLLVHEFAHGILTRVGSIKVQSIGLLLFVVPIGAFVEPDENEMRVADTRKRIRVYAAGPGTNIFVFAIAFAILAGMMIPSLVPAHDGALAVGVVDGAPAMRAGIRPSCVLVSVDGNKVTSSSDIENRIAPHPGGLIEVRYYFRNQLLTADNVTDGVVVAFVAGGFAAQQAGLSDGDVIVSLNNTPIGSYSVLTDVMSRTHAGQTVNMTVMSFDASAARFTVNNTISTIKLSDKYEYYRVYDPGANTPAYRGVGYLGAGFLYLGLDIENVTYYAQLVSRPFAGDKSLSDITTSALRFLALPFLVPITSSQVTDLYHPSGLLSWMPDSAFWLIASSLYWILWLNFAVGLFNVLPIPAFDGSSIFNDLVRSFFDRRGAKYTKEKKEAILKAISRSVSLVVGVLFLWLLIGPYLSAAF